MRSVRWVHVDLSLNRELATRIAGGARRVQETGKFELRELAHRRMENAPSHCRSSTSMVIIYNVRENPLFRV